MPRGSLSLFVNIFEDTPSEAASKRKGRSAELHSIRNECLIDRYYYYGKFTQNRYSNILDILSKEFFITPTTILELIQENFQLLADLKIKQPAHTYFQKKWPHLKW